MKKFFKINFSQRKLIVLCYQEDLGDDDITLKPSSSSRYHEVNKKEVSTKIML